MTESEIPQEQQEQMALPAAPANWMDIVRQHLTGPVFSLAFHILLIVILGTLVFIAPNAVKDDIEPVQITELEPVLPPPEDEPMPSDMTVMDTSSPNLDRYDSNEQQQMEEVGVTDVQVMTDIEIPTPLTIPDSNSALKLQGVLPFGRPGGGGKMGDGGEGDGRGNLKGMLQGVFYDLKQTKDRRATDAMGDPSKWVDSTRDRILPVLKKFISGTWSREYDKQGRVHYPELDKFYCSPTRLWNSCFYTEQIEASEAPAAYLCGKEVNAGGWVCIYSGNVVAPFSGKFRFVGYGDDILLIRFNKEIVFDYGWYSATLATCLWDMGGRWVRDDSEAGGHMEGQDDYQTILNGHPENERHRRMIEGSVIYSKHMLDRYFPKFDDNHGIAKGPVLEVQEGEVYPIEILISEVPGGRFSLVLFVEQLDETGKTFEVQKKLEDIESNLLSLEQDPLIPQEKIKAALTVLKYLKAGKYIALQKNQEELMSKMKLLEQDPLIPQEKIKAALKTLEELKLETSNTFEVQKKLKYLESNLRILEQGPRVPQEKIKAALKTLEEFTDEISKPWGQKKLEELASNLESIEQDSQRIKASLNVLKELKDGNGNYSLEPDPDRLTLFRTTLDFPEHPTQRGFPDFKPFGPIWRVVRSNTENTSSGDILKSRPQSVTTKRTEPRAEQVSEDDEDLTL